MPSTFPCATCGTPLNSTNTFSYQKHMTQCHWPGHHNCSSLPLSSISTSSSSSCTPPVPSPVTTSDSAFSVGLGKRKRSLVDDDVDDDDSGSGSTTLRIRIDTPVGYTSGIIPSQIGKRVYFTLVRR